MSILFYSDGLSWSFLMFFSLAGIMLWKRTFRGIVRFTDILEIINYILVFTLSIFLFLVLELVVFLFGLGVNFPNSYILLVHISSFVSILLFKIIIKESFSKIQLNKKRTNKVLIFGAGHSGMMVFHLLRGELNSVDRIFGFFDDDPAKRGKQVLGKKIYFGESTLEPLLLEKDITELIVAVRKITNKRKKELFDICYRHKIKLKFLPSFNWVGLDLLHLIGQ
jgi:FlaA1/EpsC-like NDP-sugar epimerase